ncbi:MAG: thiamine-phosphate synthase family protein [Sulfolobales archaeon]|nr:hypothetical protein [Sulfolobales archaeon]MDW8082714.1 thiamine-phosphate synthase family protein [Sulfolobales archaeon]
MSTPHELVSEFVIPEVRGLLARKLSERGFSQLKIAKLLGVSQSMVSRYLSANPSTYSEKLTALGLDFEEVSRFTDTLVEKLVSNSFRDYLSFLSSFTNSLLRRGLLCEAHRRRDPTVPRDCDVCLKLFEEAVDPYVEEVRTAYELLSMHPRGHEIIPEVGMNIVSAPPGAVDFRDVVGFSGRIVRARNRAIAAGEPTRGGSRHTASVLLKIMKKFPSVRSAIVIRYSSECVNTLHSAGMNLVEVGPHTSEGEFLTKLEKVVEVLNREPDAVVDIGGLGIEPVIYVLAANAIRAIKKAFICLGE